MRRTPSERNLAIVAYRNEGHTLRQTAEKFGLSPQTVRMAEWKVRDFQEAVQALKSDPDNIMLLSRAGQLDASAGQALRYGENIERISQLKGYSFRDLITIPNMGRVGAEQIVKLAAERGIEIEPPSSTEAAQSRARRRHAAMLIRVRDDGEQGISYEASVRLAGEPSRNWFYISPIPSTQSRRRSSNMAPRLPGREPILTCSTVQP